MLITDVERRLERMLGRRVPTLLMEELVDASRRLQPTQCAVATDARSSSVLTARFCSLPSRERGTSKKSTRATSSHPVFCAAPNNKVAAVLSTSDACVARRGEMHLSSGPTARLPSAMPWYTSMPSSPCSTTERLKVRSMCSSAAGTAPPSRLITMARMAISEKMTRSRPLRDAHGAMFCTAGCSVHGHAALSFLRL